MKIIKINAAFIFFIVMFPLAGYAQVSINNEIIMSGSTDSSRTINNLGAPSDSSDIINVSEAQKSSLIYDTAAGLNDLTLNLIIPLNRYLKGMNISFRNNTENTDSVRININGLGWAPIKEPNGSNLTAGGIKAGEVVKIIYNGSFFQLINREELTCPNGFIEVNDRYCIEISERAPKDFISAMSECQKINARLCTWPQWYYACQNSSLGLINMVNNWEIVDDTANHSHTCVGVGGSGCTSQDSSLGPAAAYYFRCCFSK